MSTDDIKEYIKNNLLELRGDEAEDEIYKLCEKNGIKGESRKIVIKFYKAEKKEHDLEVKRLEELNEDKPDLKNVYSGIITADDRATQIKQIKDHLVSDWLDIREDETLIFIKEICDAFGFDPELKGILKKFYKAEKTTYDESKKKQVIADDEDPLNIDFDEQDIDPALKEKADRLAEQILSRGEPIKYILKTIEKKHIGDENTEEGICVSIAGQCCLNTAGIQIVVNGESGSGKSDGTKKHLHLVPRRWKRATSLSAKALYYMDLKPGIIVFSDDVNMDPELEEVFKQSTTNYQEYTFRTSVKDQERHTISIPPRINLFLTCVQSNVSDQTLNRQLVFETDDSPEQKTKIFNLQRELESKGINPLEVTTRVLICRRIYSKLKENLFNVRIPYADRIDILDKSNSRIFPMLCDMIKGYAIFKWKQRKIDENGNLLAEIEDFEKAKTLFNSRVENTVTKLTAVETVIVKDIVMHQDKKGGIGCSISEIATRTGIKYHNVDRLIKGRKDRDDGGLLAKMKGFKKEDMTITEYVREAGELLESKGRKSERFRIENCNIWEIFKQDFISLLPDDSGNR
jgi:hypothetical protein